MATLSTLAPWVSRKATRSVGENLVALTHQFAANDLKYSSGTTALAAGDFVPLFEIPFGSTIISASAQIATATAAACTFELGVYGFTTYTGTTFSGSGSTGADTDGVLDLIDLNTAGPYVVMGPQVGFVLDENVFTDADELGKPLYVALKAITLTAQPDAGVWNIRLLVLTP